jgi:precorrin-2 dehydrogenase / sirohydrochlorin ferrochelatase
VAYGYPLMLDVSGRRILIVGGGAVAARKAGGLIEAGAGRVRVVAMEFRAGFPEGVEQVHRAYEWSDLKDADLVFAATDSARINDEVVRDARDRNIWVCRADGSENDAGDFVTPAKFESGAITVTVSAGSAALSAMVRDGLAERFDPAWGEMAEAMKQLRPFIKSTVSDPARRSDLLRGLASATAIAVLKDGGVEGLKTWISQQ